MNCSDMAEILDNRNVAQLGVLESQEIEAHLATCPACARDWELHIAFSELSDMQEPAGFPASCRATVAAGASAGQRKQARSRVILISTILAVAAAAAWLGWQLRTPAAKTAAIEEVVTHAPAPAIAKAPPAGPVPAFEEIAPTPQAPVAQPSLPGSFTVRVLPVVILGDNPDGNALVQAYRERLIVKLGRVPNLVLLNPQPRDKTDVADYDIRIRFTGEPNARLHGADIDAGKPAAVAEMARLAEGNLEDQVEYERRRFDARPNLRTSSATGISPVSSSMSFPTSVTLNDISNGRRPPGAEDSIEFTMDRLVQGMRVRIFPVSPSFKRELLAGVADTARTPRQRAAVLGDLLSLAEAHGGLASVDAETIRAAAELALTTTEIRVRESVWESLRRTKHAELVQYLVRGLASERETKVRLQIIQILSTEYSGNAQARAALENVSVQEAEPVVRMAALRVMQGESKWNEFAATTLRNASLPDLERLQPIADMAEAVTQTKQVDLQLSDPEVRELASLIMKASQDGSTNNARRDAARNALTVLAAMENPAVHDVLIDFMRMPEKQGLAGVGVVQLKTTAVRAAATRYPGDEKVLAAIRELANNESSVVSISARGLLVLAEMNARSQEPQQQPAQPR